jgi:hypothetical protein
MPQPESPDTSPQPLIELASRFMESRAFLTACELGLFTALGEQPRSSVDVARALGLDGRGTDRLMNTLVSLGLLEKSEDRFRNGPLALRYLVGQPGFAAGLMHWVHLWDGWSTLTEAVRTGHSVIARPVGDRGNAWVQAFIAAMHWRAVQHAPGLVGLLDLAGAARMLDVGGGSGAYAMEFVRRTPGLTAVVFDLPAVLPLTGAYIERAGLAGRIELAPGDYNKDPLGRGFDVVLLSAILHSNSPDENRTLLRRSAGALDPGGQVVVQEFLVSEDRTAPPFSALFALNMLVGTDAGDTYTEAEVREWMGAAGLADLRRHDMAHGTSVIVGRKPRGHKGA